MTILLETQRLILKTTEQSDFDHLFALRSDPDVMQYTEQGVQSKEDVQRFLDITIPYQKKYGFDLGVVFEKSSHNFVGQAGLFQSADLHEPSQVELGFSFHKRYWGRGYGTEIVNALIQWGFEQLSIQKIVAYADPQNTACHRVLLKCGMIQMGVENQLIKFEIYKADCIELISHQTNWHHLAETEIQLLKSVLPTQSILDIQHVGSTAIPNICAKPIIDIQIAVNSLTAAKQDSIDALKKLGYEYWADNPDPERLFFVKGMPPFGMKRTHHVHIVEPTSVHWQEKIQFRDYLLSHPQDALDYEKLKWELARQYRYDRESYTTSKTQFIRDILEKAKTEFSKKK